MRNGVVPSATGEAALQDALENVATTFHLNDLENKPFPRGRPTYLLCKKAAFSPHPRFDCVLQPLCETRCNDFYAMIQPAYLKPVVFNRDEVQ